MSASDKSASHRSHPRHRHRAMHHAAAHAADDHGPAHVPDHPLIPRGAPDWIADAAALAGWVAHVRAVGRFAYDSEFIGEISYHPKLCVLQFATHQRIALVDPLAQLDLRPVWELLADPGIEKIVHAGEQDLEPVLRLIEQRPANIFDTQVAAGFIGLPYPTSLSKLIHHLVGVRVGKGFTFTHWDQRPLSGVQIRYAADDVRFLPAMRDELGRQLAALGRESWAAEESAALCEPSLYALDRERDHLRIRGSGNLSPRNQLVLRELYAWRDGAARQADLPPRTYLRDEVLLEMSRRPPKSVQDLDRVKGLPRPVESQHGQRIVQIIEHAMSLPVEELPKAKSNDENPIERYRIESTWALVQTLCLGQRIDPALVASRSEIGELCRDFAAGRALDSHRILRGWRRAAVGEKLLDLLQRGGAAQLRWSAGALECTFG